MENNKGNVGEKNDAAMGHRYMKIMINFHYYSKSTMATCHLKVPL